MKIAINIIILIAKKVRIMEIYECYLKEVQKYALLSAEEEKELSKQIQSGSRSAVQKLVNANLRLVINVALKISHSKDISLMDLIQEGNIGLLAAAEKYNFSYGTRFSTYAYPWILQYIIRFAKNKNAVISIPQRKEELIRRVAKAKLMIKQRSGGEASVSEINKITGISEDDIKSIISYSYSFTSFEAEFSEENTSQFGNLITDFRFNPEENFLKKETKRSVNQLLNTLSEKEKTVLKCRYNFDGKLKADTLREISENLGVSAETVRQMEIRAIKKLRRKTSVMGASMFFTA